MHPHIPINYLAVAAAILGNIVIGFLWYGPILGKAWAQEMKMPPDFKPGPGVMARAMTLMVIGSLLTAWVLAHTVAVWRPSTWNAGADLSDFAHGFFAAFFTWLGFYVPLLLNTVAWEGKSWKLFGINAGYHFVALQVMGLILAFWR